MEENKNVSEAISEIKNADEESLRDYERCIADIKKILAVQLTEQNDSTEDNTSEEVAND